MTIYKYIHCWWWWCCSSWQLLLTAIKSTRTTPETEEPFEITFGKSRKNDGLSYLVTANRQNSVDGKLYRVDSNRQVKGFRLSDDFLWLFLLLYLKIIWNWHKIFIHLTRLVNHQNFSIRSSCCSCRLIKRLASSPLVIGLHHSASRQQMWWRVHLK